MAVNKVYVSKDKLDNLADVINKKADTTGDKTLDEMIEVASGITVAIPPTATIEITENGTIDVKEYAIANVNVKLDTEVDTLAALLSGTLEEFRSDSVLKLGDYAIYGTDSLKMVVLPNCEQVGTYGLAKNDKLEYVELENCKTISNQSFRENSLLSVIKFGNLESISTYTFRNCVKLKDIWIGTKGVTTLANTNAFFSTAKGINLHVRAEYLEAWKTATNWSSLEADGTLVIVGDYVD